MGNVQTSLRVSLRVSRIRLYLFFLDKSSGGGKMQFPDFISPKIAEKWRLAQNRPKKDELTVILPGKQVSALASWLVILYTTRSIL